MTIQGKMTVKKENDDIGGRKKWTSCRLMETYSIRGFCILLNERRIEPLEIDIVEGRIAARRVVPPETCHTYLLPGFVDAHVHIESSLLVPSEFARMAVLHGTVGTISDPHEIANVCGLQGVEFMLNNAAQVPFHFFFGAPSCVPATTFETAGAALHASDVDQLLRRDDIWYLAEMMNYPGVLSKDPEVMAKIAAAKQHGKPADGHAPGLRGDEAKRYAAAGLSTDHECFTLEEALDKVAAGMHIQIREGSAARNFEALHPLLGIHPEKVMFCSDDKHPDSLLEGHINLLVKRALNWGYNLFDVLNAASTNIVQHYQLPVGLLNIGDWADMIEIDHPEKFNVLRTIVRGQIVSEHGKSLIQRIRIEPVNRFEANPIRAEHLQLPVTGSTQHVIVAHDGQLITEHQSIQSPQTMYFEANTTDDLLKLAVINRYHKAEPALAILKGLGLKRGALASTVAHDSHNLIVSGCDDESMLLCINALMENKGGLAASDGQQTLVLPLPVAGLMSDAEAWHVAAEYIQLDQFAKSSLGSHLRAPFMTLSFMALLVIPHLKLSDLGLFNGDQFRFRPVYD